MGHYSVPSKSTKILANKFWKERQEKLPANRDSLGHTPVGGDGGGGTLCVCLLGEVWILNFPMLNSCSPAVRKKQNCLRVRGRKSHHWRRVPGEDIGILLYLFVSCQEE